MKLPRLLLLTIIMALTGPLSVADEGPLAVAVLDFQEKGASVNGMGEKAALLISAFLSANDNVIMVERAELKTSLDEFELNLSGTVNQQSAAQIGQLTGAKVLVTGRVFPVGKQTYVVAKVIGVETSRVFGETIKFTSEEELDTAMTNLSDKIGEIVASHKNELTAKVEKPEERLARLKELIGEKGKGKKVYVSIPEEHVSRAIPDPAVETEILMTLQELGFDITDNLDQADIRITGEAFSERASQRGQLISCRSRAEIKYHDGKNELVYVDRETEVAVDLAENIAAKTALQKAGLKLGERLIKQIATQ